MYPNAEAIIGIGGERYDGDIGRYRERKWKQEYNAGPIMRQVSSNYVRRITLAHLVVASQQARLLVQALEPGITQIVHREIGSTFLLVERYGSRI